MDKPMTLDKVRDGLQKLFDAGPGVSCNSFPLAEWIEAINAQLAREVTDEDCVRALTAYDNLQWTPKGCLAMGIDRMRAALESASLPVAAKVPDDNMVNKLQAQVNTLLELNRLQREQHEQEMRLAQGNGGVRDGWKLVPIEPTEEMLRKFLSGANHSDSWREGYRMMLIAAPKPDDAEGNGNG
jgi:hypothetical protein